MLCDLQACRRHLSAQWGKHPSACRSDPYSKYSVRRELSGWRRLLLVWKKHVFLSAPGGQVSEQKKKKMSAEPLFFVWVSARMKGKAVFVFRFPIAVTVGPSTEYRYLVVSVTGTGTWCWCLFSYLVSRTALRVC